MPRQDMYTPSKKPVKSRKIGTRTPSSTPFCTPNFLKIPDVTVLQATFSDEQRELFSKYTDCIQAFQTISECLLFQNSFRLGAKIMLEVMEE